MPRSLRPTVADIRAIKARGQKISMLYVTTLEEAAAAAQSLEHQARGLVQAVSVFKLGELGKLGVASGQLALSGR